MARSTSLILLVTVFMLFSSFCRAGTEAGDAYFKGIELASQGKLEDAKAEFQKSLDDDSVYAYARLEIHAIDDVLKQKTKRETAILVFQGKQLATHKKWDEAIALYNKAIKENPNYGYAFISKGIAYMSQGELDRAISNFSESIDVSPEYTEAYQNRGVLLEYKGQFNKALKDFDKAIAADPTSYVLYFNRGMARVYKGQCDLALPDLEKAIELKPDYAKAYINKGVALEDLKRNDEAIAAYKKAIELDSSQDKEIAKDAEASIRALEAERLLEAKKKKADDSKENK
ncbi:MAG: tetratricopeptide repeat protein [Candidatus Omnitrophica bacterium]|nr:tetratricopeptide repeat protein [Candidatus Omnitrophota bacterium]